MNKKLYIHIGTHKTGSTSIQNVLKKERKHLLKEGIFYLGRFRDISKPMKDMIEYDEKHVEEFHKEAVRKIEESKKTNPAIYVTSNEKWSGHDMLAYSNAPANARMLWDIFKPFQFDIKIVVYLRQQDKFFESAYSQKVKRGASYSFQEFLDKIEHVKDCHWDHYLDAYAKYFGEKNIIVQPFDKKYLPEKDSLIHSFGKIIGSEYLKDYQLKRVKNRGYSKDVMEIARLSNKYLSKEEIRAMKYILMEVRLPTQNYTYFPLEQRKELISHFEKSNRRVAQKYLKDENGELFPKENLEKDSASRTYEGLTPEAMAVAFAKIIVVLHQQIMKKIKENRKMQFSRRVTRTVKRLLGKTGIT